MNAKKRKDSLFLVAFISIFSFFFCHFAHANALDVTFLTQGGSRVLRQWSEADLGKLTGAHHEISAQKLIIDESTKDLELTARADVDLLTFYSGSTVLMRVPRFMIWRSFLKIYWDKKAKTLSASAVKSRLQIPLEALSLKNITKIELAQHAQVYPGTSLYLRTNPAASRGEKLFTQSCMACHSLPSQKPLTLATLDQAHLQKFSESHKTYPGFTLDAKQVRGLIAYREALDSEKTEVKPTHEPSPFH